MSSLLPGERRRAPAGADRMPRLPLLLCALLLLACDGGPSEAPRAATLIAATSLRQVLPELAAAWSVLHPDVELSISYGASGTLRRQMEAGAPVDGVLFASARPVDQLIATDLIKPSSRRIVASNALVLIGPADAEALTWKTLPSLADGELLAIGDPGAVPAGAYAKRALQELGSWDALRGRLVFQGDVAMVLAVVRRGEVRAGVVYETELRGVDGVLLLDRARWDGAPSPQIVVGLATQGEGLGSARAFLQFVGSEAARPLWEARGFGPPR